MPEHSVADARNHLSRLIDRANAGETVVITRNGTPVVALTPLRPVPAAEDPADLAFLARHRVGRAPRRRDAGRLVGRMRDDEDR